MQFNDLWDNAHSESAELFIQEVALKEPTTGQYRFSNGCIRFQQEAGKFVEFKACDVCGEACQSNMGFTIDYNLMGYGGSWRQGLCHNCARKLGPVFCEASESVRKAINKLKGR